MKRVEQILGLVVVSAALCAGAAGDAATRQPEAASIPDHEIGLAKGSVFDVAEPEPVVANPSDPFESTLLPRPFAGAPPRVAHSLEGLLPITRDENQCIDCHLIADAGEGDPTPIPASHLVDLRNAPEVVGESVAGARHVCTACHVAKTEAAPLPGSSGPPPER